MTAEPAGRPNRFHHRLDELRVAVMLLSRLPAGQCRNPQVAMGSSQWAWPLVAIPLALIMVGAGRLMMLAGLPALATAFVMLMILALLTGGMHEDGFADCADAMGAGGNRERRMEIMRDSRIGSFGAIALVAVTGVRAALLAELLAATTSTGFAGLAHLLATVTAAMMIGRASAGPVMLVLAPASSRGLGAATAHGVTGATVCVSVSLAMAALLGMVLATGQPLWVTCPVIATATGAAVCAAIWAHRKLGGYSGDTLGAGILLTETAALGAMVACGSS